MKPAAILLLLGGLLLLPCGRASAQTDFSGTWALDREISTDLSTVTFEPAAPPPAHRNLGGVSGRLGPFGGFGGGSGGRGGSGGYSRPSTRR